MDRRLTIGILVSVLCLLAGCGSDGAQMRRQLAELEQRNSDDLPMLNDTLAEALVDYFDSHGSRNERMRAKYILGRTYYDLGELPRALETYNEAADCADTTGTDCDFAKLSRVHAQMAAVFHSQVQPRSQLNELRLAEYYANRGKDTLMAIECYAQQALAYEFLHENDSVIFIQERAAQLFRGINRYDRAAQTISMTILPLIAKGNVAKARSYCNLYEKYSGFFNNNGDIEEGREVYYYIKGEFYLATNNLDSAEYLFRKELRDGQDLNNQIAGCKGLQEVYVRKDIPDSIAKYAALGYELNDSAYSLSEMQNIQKLQASYNYNHIRQLAEHKKTETQRVWMIMVIVVLGVVVLLLVFSKQYCLFRRAALDYRLRNADITRRLRAMANTNPPQIPDFKDWNELHRLVEREIPRFSTSLNTESHPLTDFEYDVCLLIRVHIHPREVSKLKDCSPSQVTKIRKSLLKRVFNKEGTAEDFDDEIGKIGNSPSDKKALLQLVKSFPMSIFGRK